MKNKNPMQGRNQAILRGLAIVLAAAGLGGSALNGGDLRPLRILGASLVPFAVVALASRSPRRLDPRKVIGWLIAAAAAALGAASSLDGLWLYLGSLAILLLAGPTLIRQVGDLLALFPLAGISLSDLESAHAPSLDTLASRELARARRANRPLSVVSISLDTSARSALARQREVAEAAASIMVTLRQTDVFGYRGRYHFMALLVETGADEALGLLDRLAAELNSDLAPRLSVGIASFPGDNPTWEGLKGMATEREQPLMDARQSLVLSGPVEAIA